MVICGPSMVAARRGSRCASNVRPLCALFCARRHTHCVPTDTQPTSEALRLEILRGVVQLLEDMDGGVGVQSDDERRQQRLPPHQHPHSMARRRSPSALREMGSGGRRHAPARRVDGRRRSSGMTRVSRPVVSLSPRRPRRVPRTAMIATILGLGAAFTVSESGSAKDLVFTGPALTIPEAGPADPYPSTITVDGVSESVVEVRVILNEMSHTFARDLHIAVEAPDGKAVVLMAGCGGSADVGGTLTFADGGTSVPALSLAPI